MIESRHLTATKTELGFGYMRLPQADGRFDIEAVNKMVDAFLSHGFTFFDTAYMYPGSEEALRDSLVKRYDRSQFEIATKLFISNLTDPKQQREQFEISLARLGIEYVDFYLLHDLTGRNMKKAYAYDTWGFLRQLRDQGLVKHIGFSFHGTADELDDVLQRQPEMEFVYLQINYLDWDDSKIQSRLCYEVARKHGKPIFVMEPTKGGLLAGNESESARLLKQANADASVASWAFRYVGGLEGVKLVLSGMGAISQIEDNARTFASFRPLSIEEQRMVDDAVAIIKSIKRIPCTKCGYCVPHCPQEIWIPQIIDDYNELLIHRVVEVLKFKYEVTTLGAKGAKMENCTKCRLCEEHCPQSIVISDILQTMTEQIR